MTVFEQDWLELGSRVARSLHYQHPRNLRFLQAAQAENRTTALHAQERTPSEGTAKALGPRQRGHDA